MENLKELVSIINKRKLSQIEVFDKSLISRKDTLFAKFYDAIAEGKIQTDEEAIAYLYGNEKEGTNYRKLKSRFKNRLLNTLYFIDINTTAESDSSKRAYFDCINRLYLSNILLRYAENRKASIQLIIEAYATARKNNFFDILKEYSYKLLVHYGMTGDEKKYNEEYPHYLHYVKEADLEQKAQLIYTKVVMTAHYTKRSQKEKETLIKEYVTEIKELVQESKSLVVYFIYKRTQLFYFEILGDNKSMNAVCDEYLRDYSMYYTSILSENYLNTIYIYKLKSLFDMRATEPALKLIHMILPDSKGVSYLAVKEFELKIVLNQKQTAKAREIITQVKSIPQYKNANAALKERWVIYNAYTEFLEHYLTQGNYKFGLSKFLNEIPNASQDKSGFNLAARILSILFFIGRNNLDNAMQQIESLKIYQSRHLKDESLIRSNLFIKLLLIMEKKSFNYKELAKQKEYLQLKEHYAKQIMHESEILFYDNSWEILIDILKRNDQKMLGFV
jgi:hypothetical protein